jgi:ribose-phosphate pyrophosphokinase
VVKREKGSNLMTDAPMTEGVLFAGSAHPDLATAIAQRLGLTPGTCSVQRFPDGETTVQLLETVRRKEVLLVQPTSPPVNDHLVELLAFIDTCRRSSAARITAIIPYFGYARADKRHGRRETVTASMVTTLLQALGVDQVVTVDLHAPQIEGFFHVPVDNLTAEPTLCTALEAHLPAETVIVSPDAGRVKMATRYAQHLHMPVAVLHKQRQSGSQTAVTHLVGDVQDRPCLIIDDMIATGGTLAKSATALLDAGARPQIWVAATHGLLLEGARETLSHEAIQAVYVTDTMTQARHDDWPRLQVVSIAPLIAEAIQRFLVHDQIRDLVSET